MGVFLHAAFALLPCFPRNLLPLTVHYFCIVPEEENGDTRRKLRHVTSPSLFMKPTIPTGALALITLALVSCDRPQANNTAADDAARQKLEETQAAYAQQAADMQARSDQMAQQLADLQRSIQDKENAEMQAKLAALQQENEKLQADAEAARQKSEELRDQLAATPVVTNPDSGYYEPPAPVPGGQAWADPEADYSMFYDDLSPHGQWLDVDGYGYAWQPAVASRSTWRPYVDGRWVWSDQGWAWDSPEPFGWACYHYGRWVKISRHGWVWVPGREWAPAWVSWRSNDDCVGWAPLPPDRHGYRDIGYDCDVSYGLSPSSYVFIETTNFGRNSYVNVCLPFTSITRIFQQTVNITNIARTRQQQTSFFVSRGGPRRDWVEGRIRGRVPVADVRIARTLDRPEANRRDRDGRPTLIAAPLPTGRRDGPRERPKIAEKIARPAIVDAWQDVPNDRRKDLRDAIGRQAREKRPAPDVVSSQPPQTPDRDRDRPEGPGTRPGQGPGQPPEVRPGIPLPGNGGIVPPDRVTGRDRDRDGPGNGRPGFPLPGNGGIVPPDRVPGRDRDRDGDRRENGRPGMPQTGGNDGRTPDRNGDGKPDTAERPSTRPGTPPQTGGDPSTTPGRGRDRDGDGKPDAPASTPRPGTPGQPEIPPAQPANPVQPETRPAQPPAGGVTAPGRLPIPGRDRDRDGKPDTTAEPQSLGRPGMNRPGSDNDAQKAELLKQREEAAKQAEAMKAQAEASEKQQAMEQAQKAREAAAEAQQKAEINRRQRDADTLKEKIEEQKRRSEDLRRQQVEAMKVREAQAAQAQQAEMARRQTEAENARQAAMEQSRQQSAMQEKLAEQQRRNETLRLQQAEAMKAREAQAAQQAEAMRQQREAAMQQQQQENARRAQAQEATAMQRRQQEAQQAEMAQRQREALADKAREAAQRQQQEMAGRQREAAQRQQQEAAQRQQQQQQQQEMQRRSQEDGKPAEERRRGR